MTETRVADAIRALTAERGPDKTCCPSEVARRLDPDGWRGWMPAVRTAAERLAAAGEIRILQRGRVVAPASPGPIRLRVSRGGPRG